MPRRLTTQAWWVLRQVCAVVLGVFVYFRVRGLTVARPSVALRHANDVLAFEHRFHLDQERHLNSLAHGGTDPLVDAANWVYIWGHWPVIIAVLAWLATRHRAAFLRLRNAMFVSGAIGLVVFVTFPVAPPRLTSLGYVDTVTLRSHAYRVLQPPAFVNPYAAMPSLHVGWDLLIGIALVTTAAHGALRAVGYAMPGLMAVAVVVTGNHYITDVVAGSALALLGLLVAVWYERAGSRIALHQLDRLHIPHPRSAADEHQPSSHVAVGG